ncbi:hypothetical protein [Massilia sp. GCM10023247]|uniref:hypothetical protein n=1 Tax=Massilia sp. GCM10023247 TaxID=3252643 RepID=UPI003621C657
MNIAQPPFPPPRHLAGIAISLGVHVLLIVLWQLSRPIASVDEAPREMEVVPFRIVPAPRVEARPPTLSLPAPARREAAQQAAPAPAAEAPPAVAPPPEAAAPPASPPVSSADLLARSKAAVAGIDRALRQENPRRGIQAPVVTPQMKLERGIARAAELAPNKWYQVPKTEEIIDPGGYGRRRYRVTTAMGTYCVTYESNHAPDGRDSMRNGIPPKMTTCDEDEQKPTVQKWN